MTPAQARLMRWEPILWPWEPMGQELCRWTVKNRDLWRVVLTDAGETYAVMNMVGEEGARKLWQLHEVQNG